MLTTLAITLMAGYGYMAIRFVQLAHKNHHPNTPLFRAIAFVSIVEISWLVFRVLNPPVAMLTGLLSMALQGFPVLALFASVLVLRRDDHA